MAATGDGATALYEKGGAYELPKKPVRVDGEVARGFAPHHGNQGANALADLAGLARSRGGLRARTLLIVPVDGEGGCGEWR